MENGTPRSAPRAFYPEWVHQLSIEATTPAWDIGPERRVDDRSVLRRVLGWSTLGVSALALALPRGRAQIPRALAAVLLVAAVAAVDALQARRRSWSRETAFGKTQQ